MTYCFSSAINDLWYAVVLQDWFVCAGSYKKIKEAMQTASLQTDIEMTASEAERGTGRGMRRTKQKR